MKKNIKLVLALVLSVMMLMTSALAELTGPVGFENAGAPFAGDTHWDTTWTGTKDGSISVGGLEPGDLVKFYRVLAYDQDAHTKVDDLTDASDVSKGAGSWKVIDPFKSGTNAITGTELKAILSTGITDVLAGKIAQNATGTATYEATVGEGATVATRTGVEDGLYVAIVVPAAAGWVYNPIFVASDYYTTTGGDKSSTWTAAETPLSYSNGAMAKKSPIEVTKEAVEPEASEPTNEQGTNYNAKGVAKGDTLNFTVKTTIPEFASNYTSPVFIVSDVMTSGLTLNTASVKVYQATVNNGTWTKGSEISATSDDNKTFTIPAANLTEQGYKIVFDPQYLLGLDAAQPIWIEYSATVSETAVTNVNREDNTVTVEYSHEPSVTEEGHGKKVRDKTHHYSWTIDGTILGDSGWKTTEVVKVGLDKDGNEITQITAIEGHNPFGPLAGAEFKLYTNSACTTEYNKGAYAAATATSDGNKIVSDAAGRLTLNGTTTGIPGLDAGEYWLKEEKAPAGYIKQQSAVHIEIIPEFYPSVTWTDADGCEITCDDLLKGYVVKIDGETTADYTLNYAAYADGKPTNDTLAKDQTTTDMVTHGDLVIGNTGPIISDTTSAEYSEHDDDGKIKNTQGVELPSTGGIGTTIFYIAGSLLVLAAAILLITKRRMSSND